MEMTDNLLYAKLVARNTPHLDFEHCNFTARNMTPKKGCGRVAMMRAAGVVNCYTLEANYNAGRKLNTVGVCHGPGGEVLTVQPEDIEKVHSWSSTRQRKNAKTSMRFTPAHYEDVGVALAVAALDMLLINPWPRFPGPGFYSPSAVRRWAQDYVHEKWFKKRSCFHLSSVSASFYESKILQNSEFGHAETDGQREDEKNDLDDENSEAGNGDVLKKDDDNNNHALYGPKTVLKQALKALELLPPPVTQNSTEPLMKDEDGVPIPLPDPKDTKCHYHQRNSNYRYSPGRLFSPLSKQSSKLTCQS